MDEFAGWIASAFTLATFACSQGRTLRLWALAANVAFILYGAASHLWPVLALHAILVPINLWRLSQLLASAPAIDDPRSSPLALLQGAGLCNRQEALTTLRFLVTRRRLSRIAMLLAFAALPSRGLATSMGVAALARSTTMQGAIHVTDRAR